MTKPECSKQGNEVKLKENVPSKGTEEEETPPATAKDLFSVFSPNDSDSDEKIKDEDKKDENYEPSPKKSKDSTTKKYIPKYKKEWENKPDLKPWLSESIYGNTYFYCKFCKQDYRCGISDIHKHMLSKKHVQRATTPSTKAQKFQFRGLLCPVFTPFQTMKKVAPDVNYKAVKLYSSFLNACGIKGILINDITGEAMNLTIKERMYLTEHWADTCEQNEQFLMVQIGGAPLKEVIELALHAKKSRVGAVVLLPDLYNKPRSHLDLIKYLKVVSEYSNDLPMLYHHNPKFTHVDIDITSFLVDIIGEVESFVGIIYSTDDLKQSTTALAINPDKFTIFMGTDEAILGAAASGFTSIMATSLNFLPKVVQSICDSVKKGDVKTAQASQKLLSRAIDVISKYGEPIAGLKAATEIITTTCGMTTREPIQTLWEGTIKKLQGKLKELGVV